jgi:pantothenate kinase-related protein Tda10
VANTPRDRPWVLGLVGLPGSGKSTLAARLLDSLELPRALTISLDDFYLEPEPRRAAGFELRGPPGTHDVERLHRFLCDLDARRDPLQVPVFDRERERRLPPRLVEPPALCLFEGWFVGARAPGYEELAERLDRLIYLDLAVAAARASRLRREATLREAGQGGMSEDAAARFWDRSLAPHIERLVLPLREQADAIVELDGEHRITALTLREPEV